MSNDNGSLPYYPDLQASEFFGWFHITPHSEGQSPNGSPLTRVQLKPGAFQDSIDITCEMDAQKRVQRATLRLSDTWARISGGLNPFATDIAASFINALVPPDALAEVSLLTQRLGRLHEQIPGGVHPIIMLHREPDPPPASEVADFLSAFAGRRTEAEFRLSSALVRVSNAPDGGRPSLYIDISY
jgi:hypothetical protein